MEKCFLKTNKFLEHTSASNIHSRRRNLVVVRAGDESLHQQWLGSPELRTFDVFVSYYGEIDGRFNDSIEFYDSRKGLKWPILSSLVSEQSNLFSAYEAVWFPDDDLLTDAETINNMFQIFHEYNLWLAQPALSPGSHVTYHKLVQSPNIKLRFTEFVEIMCPIFSRHALFLLKDTFAISKSGWGLDFVWPYTLQYPRNRIAILDAAPVKHTRPIGTGTSYSICKDMELNPTEELDNILNMYGLKWQRYFPIYESIPI